MRSKKSIPIFFYRILTITRWFLLRYWRPVTTCALSLITLFLTYALYHYEPTDTSWFYYNSGYQAVQGGIDFWLSSSAALLIYVFGLSAWVVIGTLWYSIALLAFGVPLNVEFDRIAGIGLLIYAVSVLTGYFPGLARALGFEPTSMLGLHADLIALQWFDSFGAILFPIICLIIAAALLGRSLFTFCVFQAFKGVQFLCSWQRFIKPAWRVTYSAGLYASMPFVWVFEKFKKFISGDELIESEDSLALFEYGHLDGELEAIHQDDLWHDLMVSPDSSLGNMSESEKEFVPGQQEKNLKTIPLKQESPKAEIPATPYRLPHGTLFAMRSKNKTDAEHRAELNARARILEEKLERFGVAGKVVSITQGPVVTLFEYQPDIDSKISKIIALEDDLALALQALSIRIIAPIPGKSVVGFEVANVKRQDVFFSSLVNSTDFKKFKGSIPLILGEDTIGAHVIIDLAKAPHLLIAGSTGSGKSVALNAMLVSMLCALDPDRLKLVLIDPKRLEFSAYADIAHLLFPIITDPKRACPVLKWVVQEMEDRYEHMASLGVRNIFDYNKYVESAPDTDNKPLPFIVVVIDELSDLMMTAGRDIEELIARITQMARAAGIHMIVATQRPSVDVITGLIKANFPSRISFRVSSKIDSRTILDCGGAEKLLGLGDMLVSNSSSSTLARVHGAYVSDKEIQDTVNFIREQRVVQYTDLTENFYGDGAVGKSETEDVLFEEIVDYLDEVEEISISSLQRKFRIGYNRSARIIDTLESKGRILPADGGKMRKVVR